MTKQDFSILYVDDEAHNLASFKATFRKEYLSAFILLPAGGKIKLGGRAHFSTISIHIYPPIN